MNKLIVLGKIYKEGEPKETKTGGKFLGFRLMDQQKENSKSFYFKCTAFDKTAELIDSICENGDQIFAFGQLSQYSKDKPMNFTVFEFYKTHSKKHDTNDITQQQEEDIF